MNFFTFATIVAVWIIGAQTDAMFLAFFLSLAILHVASEGGFDDKDEDEDDDVEDDYAEERSYPQVVTSGPAFPANGVENQLHFLEEPNSVGVFSYNTRTHSWDPVGEVPYPADHKPEQVATIVLDKNVA